MFSLMYFLLLCQHKISVHNSWFKKPLRIRHMYHQPLVHTLSQWYTDFCFCKPELSSAIRSRTAASSLKNVKRYYETWNIIIMPYSSKCMIMAIVFVSHIPPKGGAITLPIARTHQPFVCGCRQAHIQFA